MNMEPSPFCSVTRLENKEAGAKRADTILRIQYKDVLNNSFVADQSPSSDR